MNIEDLDQALASHEIYADQGRLHEAFSYLRQQDPLHWTQPKGHHPFWAVGKHADLCEIGRRNDIFLNGPQTFLKDDEQMRIMQEESGGRKSMLQSIVNMDGEQHKVYRGLAQSYFMPAQIRTKLPILQRCARDLLDKMESMDGACDFMQDVATWYPLKFIMTLMNIPESDHAQLLKLTLRILAPKDAQNTGNETQGEVVKEYFQYFQRVLADRRANPGDDLASLIANARIDGELIGPMEAISYYIVLATAGHDTTSASLGGGMFQLLKHPEQMARLRNNPALLPMAIEEVFRFVSPVKHFVRTASEDYEIRGKTIRKGDAVALLFNCANFDEEVFDDPLTFKIDRSPNRHVAFGMGGHNCLGQHLARLVMPTFMTEFFKRVDSIELAGEAEYVASNQVAGLRSLPVRFSFGKAAAA